MFRVGDIVEHRSTGLVGRVTVSECGTTKVKWDDSLGSHEVNADSLRKIGIVASWAQLQLAIGRWALHHPAQVAVLVLILLVLVFITGYMAG